ncbi:MAG: methyl-accepting chemotaxis protein [Rhodospirillaceae bacterium]|nr:MAG: methyl-accepting chemotaxis protein [Rhodospirillaceae bacterium]
MNLNIMGRLIAGFAAVGIILIAAIGITYVKVSDIDTTTMRIQDLRAPTSNASTEITKQIYVSLAALRGYMLTGSNTFKVQRAAAWATMDKTAVEMEQLSKNWTNPKNVENLQTFIGILNEFKVAQKKVEDVAKTPEEQPATLMLVKDAAPRAGVMVANISKMIDLELEGLGGTAGNRVQVLGMMADTRGTLGLGLANIRAYLLTGDEKFAKKFDSLWAKNTKRFNDLAGQSQNLSATQKKLFKEFSASRAEFSPLPAKMFAIRGSDKWNMANYLLVSEAAPRAGKLLNMLLGNKDANGIRQGGMQNNQKSLLDDDLNHVNEAVDSLLLIEQILLVVGVFLSAVIALLIGRSIAKPISAMTETMGHLVKKDWSVEVHSQDRTDEIGKMAAAVQIFKTNGQEVERLEADQKQHEARAIEEKRQQMLDMADSFEASVGGVVQSVSAASTEMQSSAQTLSTTAEETAGQSEIVATAANNATENVQTVASATEELSSSIQEISRQVSQSTQIAGSAVIEVESTNEKIQGLAEAANKIGEVVAMITDIADQTNLLALNATIEAARAGDAGKGFAVVASEVKNLANQTAKATEEISSQIADIQSATNTAVDAIGSIGGTINELNEISSAIAAAVEEQGAATQEIARNVEQAANGTTEVSSNIAGVQQAAGETGHSANDMLGAATELSQQSELLRSEVDSFLHNIRTS